MVVARCGNTGVVVGSEWCGLCRVHGCEGYKSYKQKRKNKKQWKLWCLKIGLKKN